MQTLTAMEQLARSAARNPEFKRGITGLGFVLGRFWSGGVDTIDSIDEWTRSHFRYRAELEEVVRTPRFMLESLSSDGFFEGDCDDVSVFVASILAMIGVPVRYVAIRYRGDQFEHVYVEAFDGTRWRVIDPTVEKGTTYNEIERMVVAV